MAHFSFIPTGETKELDDFIRELFAELASTLPREQRAFSGEYHPSLDVIEHDEAVELVVDICGVSPDAVRVLFREGVVVVVGEKAPSPAAPQQTFHLVERDFGRFARAVRVTGAFDVGRARATMRDGELSIVLPKRDERRGQARRVLVTGGQTPS